MHEAQEGKYDFEGNNDLVGFIQMAQSVGLLVIVRAGWFVCKMWYLDRPCSSASNGHLYKH